MDTTARVLLANSAVTVPIDAVSGPLNLSAPLTITILVRRPTHNGQSMKEYADLVTNGTTQHIGHEEFGSRFGASQEDLGLISDFAARFGLAVDSTHINAAQVKLSGSAEQFNQAFGITLLMVTSGGRSYISYNGTVSIPENLDGTIEYVLGLDDSQLLMRAGVEFAPEEPGYMGDTASVPLTPMQSADAYGFPNHDGYGTCIGIIELGGGYTAENLDSSFSAVDLPTPTVISIGVDGAGNAPDYFNSAEVVGDIFVAGAAAPGAKIAVYFAPNSTQGFIDAVAEAVHDAVNSPSVISISWAGYEIFWAGTAMESVLQAAAILGITVCVASGDNGAGNAGFFARNGIIDTNLYPSSSPYVLSVGGTRLELNDDCSIAVESVWNQGNNASAGGVSVVYSVPSWQSGLIATVYPGDAATELTGRGIPDVAANGDPGTGYLYFCYPSNSQVQVGGTSLAAPLWAALIARIVVLTGRRVGFVNGQLYNNTGVLRDITLGDNVTNGIGYSATAGWDACTGLGSPDAAKIYQLYRLGDVFPKQNLGFRPTRGAVYPRTKNNPRLD